MGTLRTLGQMMYDDVYDIYLVGLSITAKYDRDLETLTINAGNSVAQFRRN